MKIILCAIALFAIALPGTVNPMQSSSQQKWNSLSKKNQDCLRQLGFGPQDNLESMIRPDYYCDPLNDPWIKLLIKRYPDALQENLMTLFAPDFPFVERFYELDVALIIAQAVAHNQNAGGGMTRAPLLPEIVERGYVRALAQYVRSPNADVNTNIQAPAGPYRRLPLEIALERGFGPAVQRQLVATLLQRPDIVITDRARQLVRQNNLEDLITVHEQEKAKIRVAPGQFQLLPIPGALTIAAREVSPTTAGTGGVAITSGGPAIGLLPIPKPYEMGTPKWPGQTPEEQRAAAQAVKSSPWLSHFATFVGGIATALGLTNYLSNEKEFVEKTLNKIKQLTQENVELKKKLKIQDQAAEKVG